jgi:hypothetical protein
MCGGEEYANIHAKALYLYLVLNIAELRLYTEENGLNRK